MTQPPYHEYPQPSPGDYNPHNRPDPYQVDDATGRRPGVDAYAPPGAAPGPLQDGPPQRPQRPIYRPDRSEGSPPPPPPGAPPNPPTHVTGPLPTAPTHHTGPLPQPTHATGPLPGPAHLAAPAAPTHATGPLPPRQDAEPPEPPLVDPRIGYAPFPMPQAAEPPKRWRARLLYGVAGVLVVALVAWLVVASAGGDDEPDATVDPTALDPNAELTVNTYPPDGLLPGDALGEIAATAVQPLYATLTRTDPESGLPTGWLAESVVGSDDAREWTVTLRSDWTFHDGEPVTARSVVDSWNIVAAGSNEFPAAPLFRSIEGYDDARDDDAEMSGVEVVDERTFTVRLVRPWASFPASLTFPAFSPISPACAERLDVCAVEPVGTGPFSLVEPWSEGGPSLTYQRFDGYAMDAPAYKGLTFRFYTDAELMAQSYIGGAGDLARIPADRVDGVGDLVASSPTGAFGYIGVPHYRDGYDDAVFRRALSLAIDRPGILAASGYAHQRAAQGFTATGYPGSADDSACEECSYSPDRAAALFDQSQWPDGQTFELAYAREDREGAALAPAICEAVTAAFDIDCALAPVPYRDLQAAVADRSAPGAWIASWMPEAGTAEAYLGPLYGDGNRFGFSNERFDATLGSANRQTRLENALPMYAEAEAMLAAYMPVVPLTTGVYHLAHRERLAAESLYVDPTTQAPQFDLMEVYVSTEGG